MEENFLITSVTSSTIDYVIKRLIGRAFSYIKAKAEISTVKLNSSESDLEKAMQIHWEYVLNWSTMLPKIYSNKERFTNDTYVLLDFYVQSRRSYLGENLSIEQNIRTVFNDSINHLILLGAPGAGKSTSMRYLCYNLISDERFYHNKFSFPVVIRLRDLNENLKSVERSTKILKQQIEEARKKDNINIIDQAMSNELFESDFLAKSPIIKRLSEIFRLNITPSTNQQLTINLVRDLVIGILGNFNCLLVLDGFDEIVDDYNRNAILSEVDYLVLTLPTNSRLVLTSRTGEFNYTFPNTNIFEIAPLSDQQISDFALKWLKVEEKAESFLVQLKRSPYYDTSVKPLIIAYLCTIFESEGKIPSKPKTVYKYIINLYLKEWDENRRVLRQSRYDGFEIDRVREFLCSLAYELTIKYQTTVFYKNDLEVIFNSICGTYSLPLDKAENIFDEIESHHGLILKTGFDKYEFAHKSIQEYLTADYIARMQPFNIAESKLQLLPHELAISVAISSTPTEFFCHLVFKILLKNKKLENRFIEVFISRLVQENPDFKSDGLLGLSILNLFSLLFINNEQYELVRLINQLNLIFVDAKVNMALGELLKNYCFFEFSKKKLLDMSEVTFVKFQKLTKSNIDPTLHNAPRIIFIPDGLLKTHKIKYEK